MAGRSKKKLYSLTRFLELPEDIVFDMPRLTMLGNQQLLLENHKGIIEYSLQCVRVKLTEGVLHVTGQSLTLGNLQPEQILIEGLIEHVYFER